MRRISKSVIMLGAGFLSLLAARCTPRNTNEEATSSSDEAVVTNACAAGNACAQTNHQCIDIGGVAHCGPCVGDMVESAARVCEPHRTCDSLKCSAQHQTCQEIPNAFCKEECTPGYTWDREAAKCRLLITCDDLTCPGSQQCQQTATTDAVCLGKACPDGQGWSATANACVACAGGNSPVCGFELDGKTVRPGESGGVIVNSAGQCVCETLDNYFVPPGGTGGAAACDADGDGWVNDNAQAAVESKDPNARCHVRRVGKILLQTEEGGTNASVAEDFGASMGGLPLYESARNDGAAGALPAPYGGLSDQGANNSGKAINSLTKACVGLTQDFNANGVEDVNEDQGLDITNVLKTTKVGVNDTLLSYYKAYARYSYFLELASGWYESPSAPGQLGTYRVQERRRVDDPTAAGEPVRDLPGTPDYWKECPRHPDVLYSSASSHVGGDFLGSSLGTFAGAMGHESQFKCVVIHQSGQYPAGATELTKPQDFDVSAAKKLERKDSTGAFHELGWVVNTCNARGYTYPIGGSVTNPLLPSLDCTPGATPDGTKTTVTWAAVPGYDYKQDAAGHSIYQRGCVDLCQDTPKGGCDANNPSATCDSHLGGRTCGCAPDTTTYPVMSQLQIRNDNLCFDQSAGSTAAGAPVLQGSCADVGPNITDHINQVWEVIPTDNGWVQLRNHNSGTCMDIQGGSNAKGAPVVQNPCTTANSQQFLITPLDGQYFQLQPRHTFMATKMCLGVSGSSSAPQTALVLTDCATADLSTNFSFREPSDGTCKQIDHCQYQNGFCPAYSTCSMTTDHKVQCTCASDRTLQGSSCVCKPGTVDVNGTCVDACSANRGGCDVHATCSHPAGSSAVTCTCNAPFEGTVTAGQACIPNHCADGTFSCNEHAACNDSHNGNYTCSCHSGYSGDGLTCNGNLTQTFQRRGGDGGPYFGHNECNAGDVAVGIHGRSGDFINRLGLVCAHVHPNGTESGRYRTGPWGADQGPDFDIECPIGHPMIGMDVNFGDYLDGLSPICDDALADNKNIRVPGHAGGYGGTNPPFRDKCPISSAIYRVDVQTGSWTDSETAYCRFQGL